MSFTLVFREITMLKEKELKALENMHCMDIFDQYDKFFCCQKNEAMLYEAEYKGIMNYCKEIITLDGIKVFVAKSNFHCYSSEEAVYKYLYDYSNEQFPCYTDITERCGEVIRWRNDNSEHFITEKPNEWQIPCVNEGSRLFYMAMTD